MPIVCRYWQTESSLGNFSPTEMDVVLPQQKLICHPCNVVAHNLVPRSHVGQLFIGSWHGVRLRQIKLKQFLQTRFGSIALLGNRRIVVNMSEKESLELPVARPCIIAERRQPLRRAANIVSSNRANLLDAPGRCLNQIRRQSVQDAFQCFVELQFFSGRRMRGFHLRVRFPEQWNFAAQGRDVQQLCFQCIVQVRCVVRDLIHPVDELRFERRSLIQ